MRAGTQAGTPNQRGADAPRPAQCCAPIASPGISDGEAQTTAAAFKALADPHRVRILNLLATSDRPVCVCDLTPLVRLSQPTVSFHLKKLVSAGLLDRRREGVWSYYTINREAMRRLSGVFEVRRTR